MIDVSYTAALKLGLLGKGSQEVEVERLLPSDIDRIIAARGKAAQTAAQARNERAAPAEITALMMDGKALPDPDAAVGKGSFFVQFGAYNDMDRAESAQERLQASGVFGYVTEIVRGGGLLRLMGGPFGSREAAKDAIDRLPAALGLRPFVVKRD